MKKVLAILVSFSVVLGVCCITPAVFAKEDKIIIKYADFHPLETLNYQTQLRFEKLLEEKTNGKVDVQLFPGAQLGGQRDLIEQVKLGTIQMTFGNPPYFANYIPDLSVMDLPYMFSNYEHIERVLDGEVGKIFNEMLIEQEGMRVIGWFHIGFRHMITREKPIRKLEDFKNVKFRSPEADTFVCMFRALGAVPTPLPWPEVYQAMKTKIVDGMETTPEGMTSTKVYEVGKYVTLTSHINTVEGPTMNEAFYQSLPDDVKQALDETMKEIIPWQRKAQIEINDKAVALLAEKGCELIEIDQKPLREAMKSCWGEYVERSKRGQELIDIVNSLR